MAARSWRSMPFRRAPPRPLGTGNKRAFTVFNQTDDANRVQDIMTALTYLQSRSGAGVVNLAGLEAAGVWTCFARALAGRGVNLAADLAQFRADDRSGIPGQVLRSGIAKGGRFYGRCRARYTRQTVPAQCGSGAPAEWFRQSAKAGGSAADIRTARATEAELLDWLAPKRNRH